MKAKNIYQNSYISVPIRIRLLPLIIFFLWLLITIILFVYGPYKYDISNKFELYTYLIAVHIMLCLGYFIGMKKRGKSCNLFVRIPNMAKICLSISFIIFIASIIYTKGGDIRLLKLAIADPAAAYMLGSTKEGINLFNYVYIFTAPIKIYAIILCIFYWPLLKARHKLIIISMLIADTLGAVGSSTRGGIVATLVMIFSTFLILYFGKIIRLSKKSKLLILILTIFGLFSFFKYTSLITEKRAGGRNLLINPITMQMPDEKNFIYQIIPEEYQKDISVIIFYITHGYARLASAMELPFIGIGFGIGNSYFLIRNVELLTGIENLEDLSYGLRLDKTTTGTFGNYWQTIYPWIASDTTFLGSVFIIFIIGYLFAISWIDSIVWHNPLAVAAFAILAVLIYSFPLNNPLQDGSGVTSYSVIISCWLLTRYRKVSAR